MFFLSKRNFLFICFFLISLFYIKTVKAQILVDLYGQGSFPVLEFEKAGYSNGLGFGFGLMSNPLNGRNIETPQFVRLHAGGNFALSGFGSKKYVLELAEPQNGPADVKITNVNFSISPVVRALFGNGAVLPYIDGFGGVQFFNATETISPKNYSAFSEYEKETQTSLSNEATYFAGLSAGLLFKLSESVYANTGLSYAWGGNSNLLPLKNIERAGNELNYKFTNTPTNMLLVKIGFTFMAERSDDNEDTRYYQENSNQQAPRKKSNSLKKNKPAPIGY